MEWRPLADSGWRKFFFVPRHVSGWNTCRFISTGSEITKTRATNLVFRFKMQDVAKHASCGWVGFYAPLLSQYAKKTCIHQNHIIDAENSKRPKLQSLLAYIYFLFSHSFMYNSWGKNLKLQCFLGG